MSDPKPIFQLQLVDTSTLPIAAGAVGGAAEILGFTPGERTKLATVTYEVLDTVLSNSYADTDDIDLTISAVRQPGAVAVEIRDMGAPTALAGEQTPPRFAELVGLGYVDSMEFKREGMAGNLTIFTKTLHYNSIASDEGFRAATEADAPGVVELDDEGQAILEVRPMNPDDVVEVARLFYRVYGYSAYYAPVVYEPEKLAEFVRSGKHVATVAVTPSGRIVGHLATKVNHAGDVTGRIGLLAVEPAFRGHHVATKLGWTHLTRLVAEGYIGQYTEAVTVHDQSQRLALKTGGHECGLVLAAQIGNVDFHGFEVDASLRKAVVLFYGAFGTTPHRVSYVPPSYAEIIAEIYAETSLPRDIKEDFDAHAASQLDAPTAIRVDLSHASKVASLTVLRYGRDFLEVLQQHLAEIRRNRYDLIMLFLPLGDPLTGYFGRGLQEVGLSFCGVYPEYEHGDMLVLQSLNNVTIDPDEISVVSDLGAKLKELVVGDLRRADRMREQRTRSRAAMARIYESLG